ncbi:MAG: hypothetical protein OEV66_01080 [Spirochaetia bacterium]|nr:hypothetical protein [Spirochaetia bacterium]
MTVEAKKGENANGWTKSQKMAVWSMVAFTILLILHIYFFRGDWSFITAFFTADLIPWVMLLFFVAIGLCFYVTYHYIRNL